MTKKTKCMPAFLHLGKKKIKNQRNEFPILCCYEVSRMNKSVQWLERSANVVCGVLVFQGLVHIRRWQQRLDVGIIRRSFSHWSAAPVFQRTSRGCWRVFFPPMRRRRRPGRNHADFRQRQGDVRLLQPEGAQRRPAAIHPHQLGKVPFRNMEAMPQFSAPLLICFSNLPSPLVLPGGRRRPRRQEMRLRQPRGHHCRLLPGNPRQAPMIHLGPCEHQRRNWAAMFGVTGSLELSKKWSIFVWTSWANSPACVRELSQMRAAI